ncbi:MAG: tRNA (N(6)-L-threonylcarbamoyladenosine(37)-C(2))-methylthiotransferase MtaB [Smithellaceae bacterium]|jgi:threonylcarbamoyladenosine tRNA methylthiotransferase MtaB
MKSNKEKVALTTLGCKVNQYESAALAEDLHQKGFSLVSFRSPADVYIINTCTVTAFSDFQARQLIRRAKRANPQAKIIVTGCYAQVAAANIAALPGVNLVVGNGQKHTIPTLLQKSVINSNNTLSDDIFQQKHFCAMPLTRFSGRTRAFLKIQDGCNSFCSYCIVPFARGKSRSLPPESVLAAVTKFVQNGYREIVLTGIHLGTYGYDLNPPTNLTDVLRQIMNCYKNVRYRLSSIEPREITDELLHLLNKEDILCPHLHIPLQSGDDKILQLMRRNYDSYFYRILIEKISAAVSDVAIGVDVMVGFPGEGDAEFNNTFQLLQDLPVAYLHVFPYSERPGTAAQKLNSQVPENIKKKRASILRNLSSKKREEFTLRFLGKKLDVLVENAKDKKTGLRKGFSNNYLPVLLDNNDSWVGGMVVSICAEKYQDGKLYGKIVSG